MFYEIKIKFLNKHQHWDLNCQNLSFWGAIKSQRSFSNIIREKKMIRLYEIVMKSRNIFFHIFYWINMEISSMFYLTKKPHCYVLPINLLNTKRFFFLSRLGSPSPHLPLQFRQGLQTWTLGVFTCHDLNFNEISSKHRQTYLISHLTQSTQHNSNVWPDNLELQLYMFIVQIIIDSGKQKM